MKVLVLVAHADDESLGVGGTIPHLIKKGYEVSTVIMSNGVLDVRGTTEDNRPGAKEASKILGTKEPTFLGFPDQKFDQYPMADLANSVMQLGLEPDIIITHVETDLNLDHRITCEVAKIVGRPKRKPVSLFGCEIPNTSFWNGKQFQPNYYVDISSTLETKIKAFSCYTNELQEYPHPWSKKGLHLLAEYHGMQAGVPFAEAFQLIRGYAHHQLS